MPYSTIDNIPDMPSVVRDENLDIGMCYYGKIKKDNECYDLSIKVEDKYVYLYGRIKGQGFMGYGGWVDDFQYISDICEVSRDSNIEFKVYSAFKEPYLVIGYKLEEAEKKVK